MTIGQRIAAKRKELGLSQTDLSEHMGVSRQAISKWEADAAIPEIDKLIALSRLFSVSVDWLLGVPQPAEEAAPAEVPQPEETERKRWQAVPGKLTAGHSRLWITAAAVMAAAALVLSACSLHHNIRCHRELTQLMSAMASQSITPAAGNTYDFQVLPRNDLNYIDCTFTYSPPTVSPGTTAELVIYRNAQEFLRKDCICSNTTFTTSFSLPLATGFVPMLVLTAPDGLQTTFSLHDPAVEAPMNALHFATPEVTFSDQSFQSGILTLYNIHFDLSLPVLYRDVADPWSACDLVILVNGQEQSRVDIMNRSPYSKQINFGERVVDFTTEKQSFDLSAAKDGDTIDLVLKFLFADSLDLEKLIFTWVLDGTELKAQ